MDGVGLAPAQQRSLVEGEGKGWAEMILLLPPPASPPLLALVLLALVLLPQPASPQLRALWLQLPVVAEGLEPEVEPTAGRFGLEKKRVKLIIMIKTKRSVEQLGQLIWAAWVAEAYP